MLQILQARDYRKYYDEFVRLDISDEIVSVVEAIENSEIAGYGIYHFSNNMVIIDDIICEKVSLFDGIVRSILFIAFNNNINSAFFKMKDKSKLVELELLEDGKNFISDINLILNLCKKCKNI